jgi:hypothetical protein
MDGDSNVKEKALTGKPTKRARSEAAQHQVTSDRGSVAVVVWAASGSGIKKGGLVGSVPPEEQKYIGRLLPAGYQEPKIGDVQAYTTTVSMTKLTPTQTDAGISVPADQVLKGKIVYFEYQKPGADPIPLMAYVKPSGKLFVGVSFCPPCQGKGQRIEAGGTLVCESCGTVRTLETGVGISGACKLYPIDELPASLANGTVTIDKAVIESWTAQPLDRKVGA